MDKFTGLFGIRRIDGIPNAMARNLCGIKKVVYERIGESVLRLL